MPYGLANVTAEISFLCEWNFATRPAFCRNNARSYQEQFGSISKASVSVARGHRRLRMRPNPEKQLGSSLRLRRPRSLTADNESAETPQLRCVWKSQSDQARQEPDTNIIVKRIGAGLLNPAKALANAKKRRKDFRHRMPKWLTNEHWKQINAFYLEASRLTRETGIPHCVDHKHPLRGKTVSGLHVPWNLQVMTWLIMQENLLA